MLIEYDKKVTAVSRIHLARECAHAAVGLAERSGLADHASGRKIGIESILERAFVNARNRHDVSEGHLVTSKVVPQDVKHLHHRVRRHAVGSKPACRLYRELVHGYARIQLHDTSDRVRAAKHVAQTLS